MPVGPIARLHVVTDSRTLERPDFVALAREVLATGGPRLALHVRGPSTEGRTVHAVTVALRSAARGAGARLLVNDRVDVAMTAGADGAHLGARSLPVAAARRLLGGERLVGASVHDTEAAVAARDDGANYVFVGTIFPTASHPGRTGIGVRGLAGIIDAAPGISVLGIGGVSVPRVADVVGAGAHGVAVLGGVWSAPDPAAAVSEYLVALDEENP
jgi:thiamine-phosphate pyrophosphorylase